MAVNIRLMIVALGAILGWSFGCRSEPAADAPQTVVSKAKHDDDHHHPPEGPHGGHLIELSGEPYYHGEWLHDNERGVLEVYILDESAEKVVPISASHLTIEVAIEGREPQQYEVPAVTASDGSATAQRFQVQDKALVTALQIGEGVEATLVVNIDGQTHRGRIEHHAHDHGHQH